MAILLISYDVTDAQTSDSLAVAMKSIAVRWARPLAATWLIETAFDSAGAEALLAPLLGLDDGLIIQQSAGAPAMSNTVVRWTETGSRTHAAGADVIPWQRGKVAEAA